MIGQSIVFKPATLDVSTLMIPMRDRKRSSLPNVSFSNGRKTISLPFHSHYMNYIGPLKDGKQHGYGTIRYFIIKKGISNIYIGEYRGKWENGSPIGEGVFFGRKGELCVKDSFTNVEILYAEPLKYNYTGSLVNGKREGFGILKSIAKGNIIYEGEWKNGLYHGYGKFYTGFLLYEGQWMHGKKFGVGKTFYENGEVRYTGNWKNNMRDNFGKIFNKCGRLLYEGQWRENLKEGFGLLYGQDEQQNSYLTYSGNFKNNKKNGKGTRFQPDGEICYEGLFANDRRDGKGIKFSKSGSREDVHYTKGMLNGPATIYENDGKTIKTKGKYIKNKFVDETLFSIRKYLETNDTTLLKEVTKECLTSYVKNHFNVTLSNRQSKSEMIEMLANLHHKEQQKVSIKAEDLTEDLFGNTIETPCLGNDGEIYDLKSMIYLFEKKEDGMYRNIPYIYKNGSCTPNYPIMTNGTRLTSYSIINKEN